MSLPDCVWTHKENSGGNWNAPGLRLGRIALVTARCALILFLGLASREGVAAGTPSLQVNYTPLHPGTSIPIHFEIALDGPDTIAKFGLYLYEYEWTDDSNV